MQLKLDTAPWQSATKAVDGDGRHQAVGYWHETVQVAPGAPLSDKIQCDVAIVGGGFTGLSTAYHLKRQKPDLDVALIEAGVVGHGASGRNGGFVMPLLGWDLLYAVDKLGDKTARAAYRVMYDAVAHVKRMALEHNLDCDLEATGYLLLNTCGAREKRARREYGAAHRLGFDHQWLERDALAAYIRSDRFSSGVFDPHPCVINPAKLSRAMKQLVESLGVKVYEQTPLRALKDEKPALLHAGEGEIRAHQVMLAVNGYGEALGFMKSRVMPVHTFIVLTEPLTVKQLDSVGWSEKRASLESARNFIHYFRLTADNRILFGGEDAKLYFQGRYFDRDESVFEALKSRFREYFPLLKDVAFTHEWGGVLGVSLDMFPSFGATGKYGNLFYAGGYSGHGVALSNYAGALLAPMMLRAAGETHIPEFPDAPFFVGHRPAWLGFEPLRYMGVQAYRGLLHIQDIIEGA